MKTIDFVQAMVNELHLAISEDVKVLNQNHLTWKPMPGANPIGFIYWHFTRSEDNIISGLQGRPPVWESERWYEKLGLEVQVSGTGFKEPEVNKVAELPLPQLVAYHERVVKNTADYLATMDDARLDYTPDPNRPRRTIGLIIRNFVVAHGWWHVGEIRYLKGMQGMSAAR